LFVISYSAYAKQPHQAYWDFFKAEQDDVATDGDGYRLHLPVSKGLWLVTGKTELSGADAANFFELEEVGAGIDWSVSKSSSMYLGYSRMNFSYGLNIDNDEFKKYSLGWRARLVDSIEVNVEYNTTDFNDALIDGDGYNAGIHFYVTETFAITADLSRFYEQDMLMLGIRFTSGR
jgi:hypothetical protein